MITYLRGTVVAKTPGSVVLDVHGVGYEVLISLTCYEKLPPEDTEVKLHIVESIPMYGGGVSLYGFTSVEDRAIFLLLKEEVPGAGAKKALDYFDKVSKSLPDFQRAIVNRDASLLTGVFGFTKKTAEKLIAALKDKMASLPASGTEKWSTVPVVGSTSDAVAGLIALGYREVQAREAVERAAETLKSATAEDLIKAALRHL
jgi:Holliday junction DNA helicase RuvA